MKKAELIAEIATTCDFSQAKAARTLEAITASITAALKNGDSVTLIGFGSFKAVKREARTGRNPRTGAEIQIKARRTPAFTAGKSLKDATN